MDAMRPSRFPAVARLFMVAFACCAAVPCAQLAAAGPGPAGEPPSAKQEQVIQWIGSHALPLKSVNAGAGFEDLQPLESLLKDVQVVGLGEATHGTREIFQMKHRMLEFLVKRMGFTVFAIEASTQACWAINDYVLHGKGDKADALAGQGFWTWDTEEVLGMITWMREYNATVPEEKKVKFLGFDCQDTDQTLKVVPDYLRKIAPEFAPRAQALVRIQDIHRRQLEQQRREATGAVKDQYLDRRKAAKAVAPVMELLDLFALNRERFIASSSEAEFNKVFLHVRLMKQWYDVMNFMNAFSNTRDRYMAENIRTILGWGPPGTRMVVWAHNAHVGAFNWKGKPTSMGTHLKDAFGPAYYAFGFCLNRGRFQARDGGGDRSLSEFEFGPAEGECIEWFFARAGLSVALLDLRQTAGEPGIRSWFSTERTLREQGALAYRKRPLSRDRMVLSSSFDGLIFIENTTRARPNPTGLRPPAEKPWWKLW